MGVRLLGDRGRTHRGGRAVLDSVGPLGAVLLGIAMPAGMLFGIYFHFIEVSPDNVRHLPGDHGHAFFIATAVALVPIELLATIYAWWSLRRMRGVPSSD